MTSFGVFYRRGSRLPLKNYTEGANDESRRGVGGDDGPVDIRDLIHSKHIKAVRNLTGVNHGVVLLMCLKDNVFLQGL